MFASQIVDVKSLQLREVFDDQTLDALYSYHCLKIDCYFDSKWDQWYSSLNDEYIPKYCHAYGKKYIIEKVKRVLKKNGVLKRS